MLTLRLVFRWFVGLGVDDTAWDHSSVTKNRDRLLEGEIAAKFLRAVLAQPQVRRLLSSDHFSVDGTLIDRTRGGACQLDRRASRRRIMLGADKALTCAPFVKDLRERRVTPHVAVDGHPSKTGKPRATAVDGRVRRRPGYAASQRCRKRIEEVFGWIKSSAGMAKVELRGCARVDAAFTLGLAAYNLIRLPKLLAAPG